MKLPPKFPNANPQLIVKSLAGNFSDLSACHKIKQAPYLGACSLYIFCCFMIIFLKKFCCGTLLFRYPGTEKFQYFVFVVTFPFLQTTTLLYMKRLSVLIQYNKKRIT